MSFHKSFSWSEYPDLLQGFPLHKATESFLIVSLRASHLIEIYFMALSLSLSVRRRIPPPLQ